MSKTNHPTTANRSDSLPKATVVDANEVKGAALKSAKTQNNGNVLASSNSTEDAIAKTRGARD